MNEHRDTKLNRAIAQILEWTYGCTNIQYEIISVQFARCEGDDVPHNQVSFRVVTDARRLSNMKHPGALAFEALQMSLTGIVIDVDGRLDAILPLEEDGVAVVPKGKPVRVAELPGLDGQYNPNLKVDNGGHGLVNVQIVFHLFDGGQKSVSRTFIFRNNQMNYIR